VKNINEFIIIKEKEEIQQRRSVCYECNYKKRIYKIFNWKNATDKEILARLKRNFERFVIKFEDKNKCWDWNGFIRPDGYTRMKCFDRITSIGGHVVSWMLHKKIVKRDKLFVLHKCDNRRCTNPRHLFLGDATLNMVDMVKKGRSRIAKLTGRQVRNIKNKLNENIPIVYLSKLYGVNRATISDIRNGKTWKFIN
jgi:hypothetical protein